MSSNGTIIYIGGFRLPDGNAAAHRVLSIGKILKKLNYKVVFVGVSDNTDRNVLNTLKIIQGFECYSLTYPKNKKGWIKYLTNTAEIKQIVAGYSDLKLIIAYNFPAIAGFSLSQFCINNGIKLIADCTEWYGSKGERLAYRILKGVDTFLRMRVFNPKIDGVIVISDFLEKYYERKNSAVINIPPLIDKIEKKWVVPIIRWNDTKIHFVYSGSPGKNKDNLSIIIDGLYRQSMYSNYVFHILGIDEQQYINLYPTDRMKLIQMGDKIKFHGRVTHQESIQYIKSADYFIFLRELNRINKAGFPTKFVEAITCNTKVITNNSTNVEKYLVTGQNGYLIDLKNESFDELFSDIVQSQSNKLASFDLETNDMFDFSNYTQSMISFLNTVLSQ